MKTTGLTLSEALATGRPFRKHSWTTYLNPNNRTEMIASLFDADFFEPVWEVQEEEKPPMRVWLDKNGTISIRGWSILDFNEVDITESLAKALAPYIKKELGL